MFNKKSLEIDLLTKKQKSMFLSSLRAYTKKFMSHTDNEICELFLEEEKCFDMENSKFSWIRAFLYNEKFLKEVKYLIKEYKQKFLLKEKQKPIIEKRKAYEKVMRKKATEWRQSREKPTKKQILYYLSLCKQQGVDAVDLKEASKLDLKKLIAEKLEKKGVQHEL